MPTASYSTRRNELETYFDRTAVEAWKKLTSDAPVSWIRATVRAGREKMRALLLYRLGADLSGQHILDAGCGTGALAIAAAKRGARVTAIDLSENLVNIARENARSELGNAPISFHVGDMLDPSLGRFDQIVAMDSLIHYQSDDMLQTVSRFAKKCSSTMLFTFAPRTPLLATMHTVGKLFPRSDRAPAIVPVSERNLRGEISNHVELDGWQDGFSERIVSGFYTSQAMELKRV